MINYFNLIRALQTDQYDELTVKELKEHFNTEPDIDNSLVVLCPEPLFNERTGMSIVAHMAKIDTHNIILVDTVSPSLINEKNTSEMVIRAPNAPMIEVTAIIPEIKHSKFQKQQQKYRSHHHKK